MRNIFLLVMLAISMNMFAQGFSCSERNNVINRFNTLQEQFKKGKKVNIKEFAIALKDGNFPTTTYTDGSFEYVFIFESSTNYDINQLRKITMDYIVYRYNIMSNESRSYIERNSPIDGVSFMGVWDNVNTILSDKANVNLDFSFKKNRIRLRVSVNNYITNMGKYRKNISSYFPYTRTTFMSNEKQEAQAYVSIHARSLDEFYYYEEYLNGALSRQQQSNDW